jgi:hypothetical protein
MPFLRYDARLKEAEIVFLRVQLWTSEGDQTCERSGSVEIKRGVSLFAYLAHFVSQDNERVRGRSPVLE